jgi:hypothetical protein
VTAPSLTHSRHSHLSPRSSISTLSVRHLTTYIKTMLPSLYRTIAFFLITLTFILTYLPMPVSSLPIVIFEDRTSYDKLVFDVSFFLGTSKRLAITVEVFYLTFFLVLLLALTITWAWITCRMTVDLFILWVNRKPSRLHVLFLFPMSFLRPIGRFHHHISVLSRPIIISPLRHHPSHCRRRPH